MSKQAKHKWKPPPKGILKINTDGSFTEETHSGGWGFTIRNDQGTLLAACAGNLNHVSNPLHVEALALQQATITATHLGCQQVTFETDFTTLKEAITSNNYDLSALGTLFTDVKFKMYVGLNVVSVNHCSRGCNKAAHMLAASGVCMESGCYETWLGHFQPFWVKGLFGSCPELRA